MCRAEVAKLYKRREELRALGVRLACVLRENLPEEVAAFRADVWQGERVFLDPQLRLFDAIAGGNRNEKTPEEYMKTVNAPTAQDKANRERALTLAEGFMGKEHHNTVGAGLVLGGVYVVRRGGAVEFAHHESFVGDTADPADIVGAAARAASSSRL